MQNKPVKKVPERHCIGCGAAKGKNKLIRIVRCPDGVVTIDFNGKKSGRGVYICPEPACFKKAVKTDEPVAKGSAYVGLVLILGGISNIFAFGTLFVLGAAVLLGFGVSGVNVALYVPVFLLSELSVAAIAVYNIGFGVLMFRYKSSMKKIRKQFER